MFMVPLGTFDGGREKAPAALCRKIINAKINNINEIEVWGDGEQTRSFMYIDDCLIGTQKYLILKRLKFLTWEVMNKYQLIK